MNPNVAAFLRVIRHGETNQTDDAYRMIFGGGLFDSFADHPRKVVTRTLKNGSVSSSAAGAYQFLRKTWDALVKQNGYPDFSPASQDLAAVALIRGRKALADVEAGRFTEAIRKCAPEWASLPGDVYGQGAMSMSRARSVYESYGGTYAPLEEVMPFPAILGAVLPSLISSAPELMKLFGSGSQVADRNVKAATILADIATTATGSANLQEAVEKIEADPAAKDQFRAAVQDNFWQLSEVSGGVGAARKADETARSPWLSNTFWIACLILPLVYMIVWSVAFGSSEMWPAEVRSAIATGVVSLVLGGIAGYYFGASRNVPTR